MEARRHYHQSSPPSAPNPYAPPSHTHGHPHSASVVPFSSPSAHLSLPSQAALELQGLVSSTLTHSDTAAQLTQTNRRKHALTSRTDVDLRNGDGLLGGRGGTRREKPMHHHHQQQQSSIGCIAMVVFITVLVIWATRPAHQHPHATQADSKSSTIASNIQKPLPEDVPTATATTQDHASPQMQTQALETNDIQPDSDPPVAESPVDITTQTHEIHPPTPTTSQPSTPTSSHPPRASVSASRREVAHEETVVAAASSLPRAEPTNDNDAASPLSPRSQPSSTQATIRNTEKPTIDQTSQRSTPSPTRIASVTEPIASSQQVQQQTPPPLQRQKAVNSHSGEADIDAPSSRKEETPLQPEPVPAAFTALLKDAAKERAAAYRDALAQQRKASASHSSPLWPGDNSSESDEQVDPADFPTQPSIPNQSHTSQPTSTKQATPHDSAGDGSQNKQTHVKITPPHFPPAAASSSTTPSSQPSPSKQSARSTPPARPIIPDAYDMRYSPDRDDVEVIDLDAQPGAKKEKSTSIQLKTPTASTTVPSSTRPPLKRQNAMKPSDRRAYAGVATSHSAPTISAPASSQSRATRTATPRPHSRTRAQPQTQSTQYKQQKQKHQQKGQNAIVKPSYQPHSASMADYQKPDDDDDDAYGWEEQQTDSFEGDDAAVLRDYIQRLGESYPPTQRDRTRAHTASTSARPSHSAQQKTSSNQRNRPASKPSSPYSYSYSSPASSARPPNRRRKPVKKKRPVRTAAGHRSARSKKRYQRKARPLRRPARKRRGTRYSSRRQRYRYEY